MKDPNAGRVDRSCEAPPAGRGSQVTHENNCTADNSADTAHSAIRLRSLTGARWLAAVAVFVSHAGVLLPLPGLTGAFALGVSGVSFFFVLSGFVLVWTGSPGDRPAWFYARRFARVWPLLVIAVLLPLAFALAPGQDVDRLRLLLIAGVSILLVQAWIPGWILTGSNPVTWSLSCEAFFYAVLPGLLKPLERASFRTLMAAAAAVVLVAWTIRIGLWVTYPPDPNIDEESLSSGSWLVFGTYAPIARIPEFLLGAIAAAALRKGRAAPLQPRTVALAIALAFAALWLFRDEAWRSAVPFDPVNQVMAPLFALFVWAAAARDVRGGRSWLASGWMQTLGNWSYAFYLFHFTVLLTAATMVYPDKTVTDFFLDPVTPGWSHLLPLGITLLMALGMSAALYRWFEAPLERRLRRSLRARLDHRRGLAEHDTCAPEANQMDSVVRGTR